MAAEGSEDIVAYLAENGASEHVMDKVIYFIVNILRIGLNDRGLSPHRQCFCIIVVKY